MSGRKLKIHSQNSTKSSAKSSTRSSPINFEDLNLNEEKKIENVFELIDKLNPDMQREVFSKLMSFNPSNANSRKLSLVNNQFADVYSYTRKLTKIKSKSPTKTIPIKSLSKQIDRVVATVGDLKIKTLEKYSPVKDQIYQIFHWENIQLNDEDDDMFAYDTLAEAKETYEFHTHDNNDKEFEKKKQEFIESWNFQNSDGDYSFHRKKKEFDEFRWQIENYDKNITKDEKKKIDAYIKASDNITYAEYIKLTRELPIGAKVKIIN